MSALRLLNETTFSSVSTVNVTDVFSADYDIYKITMDEGGQYGNLRFINSAGSILTDSSYDTSRHNLKLNTSYSDTNVTGQSVGIYAFSESSSQTGGGNVITIFNPFQTDTYTMVIASTVDISTSTNHRVAKAIGIYKNLASATGFQLNAQAGVSGTLRTYGLRVDS